MLRKTLFLALIFSGIFFVNTSNIFACVCFINNTSFSEQVSRNLKNADAIFSGKVIALEYRKLSDEEIKKHLESDISGTFFQAKYTPEILTVKIKVFDWWKGYKEQEIVLLTETYKNSTGNQSTTSCEREFKIGQELLLFARGKDKNHLRNLACSLTGSLDKSQKVTEVLGKGYKPDTSENPNR